MPDGQRVPPGAPDEAAEQEASLAEEAAPEISGPPDGPPGGTPRPPGRTPGPPGRTLGPPGGTPRGLDAITGWLAGLRTGPVQAGSCSHAREVPGYRIPDSLCTTS
jgi:hypothetical protein